MSFALSGPVLDAMMPMHVCISANGAITHWGPTIAKLFPAGVPKGFFTLFDIRRPGIADMTGFARCVGQRLHLGLRGQAMTLRGIAMPMDGGGYLLNLSFGVSIMDAILQYDLNESDFAATDLTMEVLYVVEAKTAVMEELGQLNLRLQGAKFEAEEWALTDTLTGLRNRRALDMTMTQMIAAGQTFALMHIDLDFFKAVNDSLGHAAGDYVLTEVARILSEETRTGDMVTRVGGDEFVLILPGMPEPALIQSTAQRIIHRLNEPMEFGGKTCRISASIGMTLSTLYDPPEPERMLSDADQALYASKHGGRGQARLVPV